MTEPPNSTDAIAAFYDATVGAFGALFDGCVHTGYWARGAEDLSRAQTDLTDLVLDAHDLPADGRLIDLGSGQGGPAIHAARRFGAYVVGVTLSAEQAEAATAAARETDVAEQVEFQVKDMRSTGLPDAAFDGAYAMESVFHVPDKGAAFAEAFRVLKPGAVLSIADYHHVHDMTPEDHGIATGMLAAAPLTPLDEWVSLMTAAGFESVEARDISADVLRSGAAMREAVVERREALTAVGGPEGYGMVGEAVAQYTRIYTEGQGFALFTARKPA
ncbi:MAG TPA: methyltransferase domain-containing protein [Phytomonospora sp.]